MVKILPKAHKTKRPTKFLIPFSVYRSRLAYRKLPEQLLRLTVIKLDGTSFSFHVARNATVGKLKLAIQEEFNHSSKDERKKLWSLVWSHFCLCYEGQKLLNEKAYIKKYGIKDGDQLCFVQHLSIDLAPAQQISKNQTIESKRCSVLSAHDARMDHLSTTEDRCVGLKYFHCEQELAFPLPKSKPTHTV